MKTRDFLELIFGDNTGYLMITTKDEHGELNNSKGFKYPDALNALELYCSAYDNEDIYFSPMLFSVPKRRSNAVMATPVVYADTDMFDPAGFLVEPSINIITSQEPIRRHSYWILGEVYTPDEVSAVARAIAITHASKDADGKQAGVDPGGWDLGQLLRLPNSYNTKHNPPQEVQIEEASGAIYSLEEIVSAYDAAEMSGAPRRVSTDMPEELPEVVDVLRRVQNMPVLKRLYAHELRAGQDRSELMYAFCSEMLRSGFTPEETLVVAWQLSYNKYKQSGRPMSDLWTYDVSKAAVDPENTPRAVTDKVAEVTVPTEVVTVASPTFMRQEEIDCITPTFVDSYVAWVKSQTDAPESYSVAGALTILSCVLSEWGYARPDYGEVPLGLFFFVMGETTKTRKSTTRKKMKKLLRAVETEQFEYTLTSDTTPESLLDDLSERANQASLYDRDEAQQLIEDVKGGRGYMKGFFETLNDLYDGVARGRSRSTKKTKEANVIFVQFMMGIRTQIQERLEISDFTSGYLTRNIFVRGDSTADEEMPGQGAPGVDHDFMKLSMSLVAMRNHWQKKIIEREDKGPIYWSDEAWERLWEFKKDLEAFVAQHNKAETLSAAVSRLYENTMRVGTLLAMADMRDRVELGDLYNAMAYATEWAENLIIMVDGVTQSELQRELDKVLKYVELQGGLVTTVQLLKWATKSEGWRKFQLDEYVATLQDMEMIQIVNDGAKRPCVELL